MPIPRTLRLPVLLLAVTPLLALAGCTPDHTDADLKTCIAQATADNPIDAGQTEEQHHDAIGSDVKDCMKGAGYRQDTSSEKCLDDLEFNAACYARRRT